MPESSRTTSCTWRLSSERTHPGRPLQADPAVHLLFRHHHGPGVVTDKGGLEIVALECAATLALFWVREKCPENRQTAPPRCHHEREALLNPVLRENPPPSSQPRAVGLCSWKNTLKTSTTPTTTVNWNVNGLLDRMLLEL